MQLILQTERLILRKLVTSDTAFIIELLNSPGWLEYIGDRNVKTEQQAKEYLQNGPIKSYEVNGFGLWLLATKNDNAPIGMCGILKRESLAHPDIGFALLPAYTGKGYAFEIASATIQFARQSLQLPVILAIVLPVNKRSIMLIEKIGLKFEQFITSPGNEELMLFSSNF